MGKPLSRPDCLRQNPTCLGKGEEEDGYIEDCYVPQRSIYDTMRINEQIDQGSKLNQTSKSTMEKMEGSTISSNGTLGAASNVFESRAPEGKKLDERIIFDALKLSSDVQKSAPVPPRRRPNAERKDNVNRRSWKSFMPPNFPEFAESMEASLSEVSEAGASNPSLQEKKESSSALTESSGHLDHREPQSESVTLEHVSKSMDIPEVQDMKNLSGECQDFRLQPHSEHSPREFQPLESEAAATSGNTDVMQEHRFSSATWPRAMKSLAKGGFSEKQHPLGDTACTVEMPPLSPCLSEELLDPELHILITPSLREKTESELKFEEDERWIMMEAEEEWEEEKLSERAKAFLMADEKKNSLADTVVVAEDGADCSAAVLRTFDHLALGQICCSDDLQPAKNHLDSVFQDTPLDYSCVFTGESAIGELTNRTAQGLEGFVSDLECTVGLIDSEQLSDTDSVQMFLELEKECLCEEGVTPLVELEKQASSEGLAPSQDAENSVVISHFPGADLEEEHIGLLNVRVKDSDTGLDYEYFNALDSSQVPNALELIAHSDTMGDTSTVSEEEHDKVPSSPKTAGEFKFRHPGDLVSLGKLDPGEIPNSDHRASHEEDLSAFVAELAKENGNLSQVDCSHIEGNFEEYVERVPLSCAFSYELTDVTSVSEVEALSHDSHLLTDEIHLESEKGAINQESNNLTSLGNMDPCELSKEEVWDEDGEVQELGYETRLSGDQAPAHFHRTFPEQIFQALQRKCTESDGLNLPLLVGGPRPSRDGLKTMNETKPKLTVASSERGETEMRDSDSLLNIFLEEQVTKASSTEPALEGWTPIPQKPIPAASLPATEDGALNAALLLPEVDVLAVAEPAPEADTPVVSVATTEAHVPVASVATKDKDILAAPPAVAVATMRDDILEGSATPAFAVPAPEESVNPADRVPTPEEPAIPADRVPNPEEPAAPADGVPISEEPAAPAVRVPTPEEPIAPSAVAPTLEEPAAPAAAVPTPEEPATPADRAPTLEGSAAPADRAPTPEEPATPADRAPTPEGSAAPADRVPTPEGSAAPADRVPTPEEPATPADRAPTPEGSAAPADRAPTPEGSAAPADRVPTPEGSAALADRAPTPEGSAAPADRAPTPEGSAAPADRVPTLGEPKAPGDRVPTPEGSAASADRVPTPEEPATPADRVPTPEGSAASADRVPTPGEPATPADRAPTPEGSAAPADRVPTPEGSAAPANRVPTPEEPTAPADRVPTPEGSAAPADRVPTLEEPTAPADRVPTPEMSAALADRVPTLEGSAAPAAARPAMEEMFLAGAALLGDTAHTDSVPISEEGTPILEETSPTRMWIKGDLDSSGFEIKEVTGTVLHGKVPLATTDELNSNEVIVAHFVGKVSVE
ncbi:uncharacterized protein KIAA0754 homolog [Hyaena hyaena]|uniref:uncharacterized protein KIAA0754 homolog n=1 Tax=Hyaena hyaena TaxID=95912 RepID=UPI001923BCA6|nr:uncharacterized protein KIAA0754 homolog [Hyaena hyaena]